MKQPLIPRDATIADLEWKGAECEQPTHGLRITRLPTALPETARSELHR
jgi:hypothetical protein